MLPKEKSPAIYIPLSDGSYSDSIIQNENGLGRQNKANHSMFMLKAKGQYDYSF